MFWLRDLTPLSDPDQTWPKSRMPRAAPFSSVHRSGNSHVSIGSLTQGCHPVIEWPIQDQWGNDQSCQVQYSKKQGRGRSRADSKGRGEEAGQEQVLWVCSRGRGTLGYLREVHTQWWRDPWVVDRGPSCRSTARLNGPCAPQNCPQLSWGNEWTIFSLSSWESGPLRVRASSTDLDPFPANFPGCFQRGAPSLARVTGGGDEGPLTCRADRQSCHLANGPVQERINWGPHIPARSHTTERWISIRPVAFNQLMVSCFWQTWTQ